MVSLGNWRPACSTVDVLTRPSLEAYGSKECLRITPLLWGHTVLYTRSPDVLRQVAGGGSNKTWIKPAWWDMFQPRCGYELENSLSNDETWTGQVAA